MDELQSLDEFKKSLEGKTIDELKQIEQAIIAEADKIDTDVAAKKYKMSTKDWSKIGESIRYFLNKETVDWQYTLGLIGMYDFWDPKKPKREISFPMIDSTLRTIGRLMFTGYKEWAMVVAINKYIEPISQDYRETSQLAYDVADKHNAVLDAMAKAIPIGQTINS